MGLHELFDILGIALATLGVIFILYIIFKVRRRKDIDLEQASLTMEELEAHVKNLVSDNTFAAQRNLLIWPLTRIIGNYDNILQTYKCLNVELQHKHEVPPAAEWFLDNFYTVEEQVKIIRRDFTKKYYYSLPVIKKGQNKGHTRIFELAMELISHRDGLVEENTLLKYIDDYQKHNILFEREICAIPIMLKLALIEHICALCTELKETQKQWDYAEEIYNKWCSGDSIDIDKIMKLFKTNVSSIDDVNSSMLEHLLYKVRQSGKNYSNIVRHVDEYLNKLNVTTENLAHNEHNKQATITATMRNCIISLKYVSGLNWTEIFEKISHLDKVLRDDPDGTYLRMDSYTKSYYKNEIEKIAKIYRISELYVAREAVAHAKIAYEENLQKEYNDIKDQKKEHVGYYLVGQGRKILESKQTTKARNYSKGKAYFAKHPGFFYFGLIISITLFLTIASMYFSAVSTNKYQILYVILTLVVILLPASEIAISIVNCMVCRMRSPAIFPRLELKEGIPENLSTFVIIPALITSESRVKELLENLENHYLANREDNLYFAIISALKDSKQAVETDDEVILNKALAGIKTLNDKYAIDGTDVFYLYHRSRKFNDCDNVWISWERKRGALMEFNELLLGGDRSGFSLMSNEKLPSAKIRYVITLDADTILPLGMAKKMIGTMAHKLNIPVIDKNKGIVVDGYGVMQPKVSFDMDSSNKSIFSRIYTGQDGMDPYACAVSNVYQDLFYEGIYTGKGIYDLEVFEKVLNDVIPDNSVLSHDLLEGSYARCAMVSNLELIDSYPAKFNSYMARLYRWIRGDWQLVRWLRLKIYNKNKKKIRNPLPYISIWKITDNLRRSLVIPSLFILIVLGVSILPGGCYYWLAFSFVTLGLPFILSFIKKIFDGSLITDKIKRHMSGFFGLKGFISQFTLSVIFMPYQSLKIIEAILVTLNRVFFTKKKMLEWVTSADVEKMQSNTLKSYFRSMWIGYVPCLLMVGLTLILNPLNLYSSLILVFIWSLAPYVAFYISQETNAHKEKLEEDELVELRKIARKTWRYFEEFINAENNYLAPDNLQEAPPRGISYRTSPTNIGLGILSTLCARDMGYIGTMEAFDVISKTITTIEKLDKWNGHIYNWYDTKTLKPLEPIYISTVDSGNYVCDLITLEQGLKEYCSCMLADIIYIRGIKDTLRCSIDEYEPIPLDWTCFDFIEKENVINLMLWNNALNTFKEKILLSKINKKEWKVKIERMMIKFKAELKAFAPWIDLMEVIPGGLFNEKLSYQTNELLNLLQKNIRIKDLTLHYQVILKKTEELYKNTKRLKIFDSTEELSWLHKITESVENANNFTVDFLCKYNELIKRVNVLSTAVQFSALYDERKNLFTIGYNLTEHKLTDSYYDLLASEARQASYIAIARGEVPPKHWFMLGRSLTTIDCYKGLISWSGTMFEYLMPLLIMKNYVNSLLDETYSFVIKSQIKYGRQRKIPWGTSESSFNSLDNNLDYQYKANGVPWLGYKRGLVEDAVTAPYATFLALMVKPYAAYKNIKALKEEGLEGNYGYYEAADYTAERLDLTSKRVIIKSYMAHHQGMSLLAIINYLNNNIMQRRFSADPNVKAARVLLQEKIPLNVIFTKDNKEKISPYKGIISKEKNTYRKISELNTILPQAHILSNGGYSVMLTDRGTGYSRTKSDALTRWHDDSVIENYGMFFYIKNNTTKQIWSATYAPLNVTPAKYEVIFTSDKATYKRVDGDIETYSEIVVASGDNAEIRKIRLKNNGRNTNVLEVTSYAEIILAPWEKDIAHPAFSNLFIKTEFNTKYRALIATRRSISEADKEIWTAQIPIVDGKILGDIQHETDRNNFIGRGNTVKNPVSVYEQRYLSDTDGPAIDPILSLRVRVQLDYGKAVKIFFVTIIADSKEALMEKIEKYSFKETCETSFWLAYTRSQVETGYLNISAEEIELYQKSISHILYNSPLRKKYANQIMENKKGQASLWAYGISGDKPILLVTINNKEETDILYDLLKAHEYWRLKDLNTDLVILCNEQNSYENPLFSLIKEIVYSSQTYDYLNIHGDIFIINMNNIPAVDISLFYAVSKLVFLGNNGTMAQQMEMIQEKKFPVADKKILLLPEKIKIQTEPQEPSEVPEKHTNGKNNILYNNGLGGFDKDGKEYVINLSQNQTTPAPWVNIIANQNFGFIVSESGGGYTWCDNSREFKLTPWTNDPVCDGRGEIFYLKDENGEIWSLTPLPIREKEPYKIKHGFGYTEFEHISHGITQKMTQFVPVNDAVKISLIALSNDTEQERTVILTYYITPVLGVNTMNNSMHLISSTNENGTFIVENPYNREFSGKMFFIDSSITERSVTGDRKEFFGTEKEDSPLALKQNSLSGNVGIGYDCCGALMVEVNIKPFSTKEIVFVMGVAESPLQVKELSCKYLKTMTAKKALRTAKNFWLDKIQVIQVDTPNRAMNIMLNGWLLYQVMSCRLMARSAFYQAGGAYGFRDQLQDCLSIANISPDIVREQIIKHAKHQFKKGDVMHWWHEPTGKGTRTRISDDFLWLPYVTAEYIKITGDFDILQTEIPFVEGNELKITEAERYFQPSVSRETTSLYDHCIRAVENAMRFSERGLPLIRNGDWNDGMNTVGNQGKGESIWLGWFLYATLQKIMPICVRMGELAKADNYLVVSKNLATAIEQFAWDGSWYRRAFYDNGDPLGSAQNSECKIDSLSQSWSVISGAGDSERIKRAMKSLEENLVCSPDKIIKLLTPPFDDGPQKPGYIKGYTPGVRENGGQYTHAATWVIIAFALLGDGNKALEMFDLINPINHTNTIEECSIYKTEPYVLAADVYGEPPFVGRGGWTWYTGAASWMYKAGIENILGFKKNGDQLIIEPCISKQWPEFSIKYKYMDTFYDIKVINSQGKNIKNKDKNVIYLVNDKEIHNVEIVI